MNGSEGEQADMDDGNTRCQPTYNHMVIVRIIISLDSDSLL
jgi:hypothetical protein